MLAYAIRRILILIPTVLGMSIIVFFMLHLTPGDPAELLLGGLHIHWLLAFTVLTILFSLLLKRSFHVVF